MRAWLWCDAESERVVMGFVMDGNERCTGSTTGPQGNERGEGGGGVGHD